MASIFKISAFRRGFRPIPLRPSEVEECTSPRKRTKLWPQTQIESQYLPSIFSPRDMKCNNRRSGKRIHHRFPPPRPTFCVRAAEFHPANSTRNSTTERTNIKPLRLPLTVFVHRFLGTCPTHLSLGTLLESRGVREKRQIVRLIISRIIIL